MDVDPPESHGEAATTREDDFAWTCGGDAKTKHIKKINHGAFGDVHMMKNQAIKTVSIPEIFARKVLKPLGSFNEGDVENEFEAIKKLCVKSESKNVVAVFRYGQLLCSHFFFIDMELCDLNLEQYIYGHHEPQIAIPPLNSTRQIWAIMQDATAGLSFIHENNVVHRDIKPTNLLYSCDQGVWKIADFGFSREWTSKTTLATSAARGTETYRAPELVMREEATFSDRSDIWAAGCILFELASRTKAFRSDWNVGEYARSQIKLLIPLQRFVEADTRVPLTNLVHEMLQIEPKRRPSAKELCALFEILVKRTWYTFLVETDIALLSRISQSQEEEQSAIRILGPMPQVSPIFSVTYARNPFFSGRDAFLDVVSQELVAKKPRQYNHRIALYGLGGVGKTQVALEYAYRHRSDYTYVFWVPAVDQAQLLSGFANIASLTGCTSSLTSGEDMAKGVLRWLRDTENWLLILDNLDDISVAAGYLPEANGAGHTLITTRNKNSDGIPANGLEVREMDATSAVQFLLGRVRIIEPAGEEVRSEAHEIVKELGFLPLAIDQAAAYIRTSQNIFEYRKISQDQRKDILRWRPPGNYDYTHTVATAWRISLDRLNSTFPDAVDLIRYFAFMNPDEIQVEFLRAGANVLPSNVRELILNRVKWTETVGFLETFSLIRVFGDGDKLSIHRLVQAVIQDDLDPAARSQISVRIIALGLKSFPAIPYREWGNIVLRETCRRFRSQVTSCLEQTQNARETSRWLDLASRLVLLLLDDAFYLDAYRWARLIFEIRKKMLGNEHIDTIRNNRVVGLALFKLGRVNEAFQVHWDCYNAYKTIFGPEHLATVQCLEDVSRDYFSMGRLKEGLQAREEALRIRTNWGRGREDPGTLWCMFELGLLLYGLGRYGEAEKLFSEVLDVQARDFGSLHPDTISTMVWTGRTFSKLGRHEESESLHRNALTHSSTLSGREHPSTLHCMESLATIFLKAGQIRRAVDICEEAWSIANETLSPENKFALDIRFTLAKCYRVQGEVERAMRLLEECWEIRKATLGCEHPDTLLTAREVALACMRLGGEEKAIQLLERTFEAELRVLGVDHPGTLLTEQSLEWARARRSETASHFNS